MKYVNILLIGLVLLFPGCTFLDVVPEGNIESIESNFEKRDQTENWFKYCHFWDSPFTTSVISNPAYMGTDEVVAGTYLRESGFNWSGLYTRMVCSVRSIHTVICGVGMQCITVSVIVILFLKKCGEFII